MRSSTCRFKMMKKVLSILILALLAIGARAQIGTDTVMVYNSWDAIYDCRPDTVLINPDIIVHSAYDFEVKGHGKQLKKILKEQTVAIAIGDTTWLINSEYLKRNFKGEAKRFSHFLPMYFNSDILFVQYTNARPHFSTIMLGLLSGDPSYYDYDGDFYDDEVAPFYLVDFDNAMVYLIDHNFLLSLLDDFPDLRRRYESMRDCGETYMVNSFFLDYVKRISR